MDQESYNSLDERVNTIKKKLYKLSLKPKA
ncbi:hypothetical protein [Autumnicola lenta]